jgi:benzoyl-CoA reductase/2-hydroxyglutaryl-CoA dehydratase subunit BcrC/BadD/HgdB
MEEKTDHKKIISLVGEQSAAIKNIDSDIMMETVGVAMAIGKLREAIDKLEANLNAREYEQASHIGYNDVAHNFVYLQRTLAGLSTIDHQKDSLISSIAQKAHAAYEDVAPYVEKEMSSSVKKQ